LSSIPEKLFQNLHGKDLSLFTIVLNMKKKEKRRNKEIIVGIPDGIPLFSFFYAVKRIKNIKNS